MNSIPRAYHWGESPIRGLHGLIIGGRRALSKPIPAVQPWSWKPPLLRGCSRSDAIGAHSGRKP